MIFMGSTPWWLRNLVFPFLKKGPFLLGCGIHVNKRMALELFHQIPAPSHGFPYLILGYFGYRPKKKPLNRGDVKARYHGLLVMVWECLWKLFNSMEDQCFLNVH
jgi:hypothetical protein